MRSSPLLRPQARVLALRAQGLAEEAAPFGRGVEGALGAVRHLGYVQVDTIHVVERAHHHVLWTRVPDYRPEDLHALQAEGRVFEYWNHAASYLPTADYRFSRALMRKYQGECHWGEDTAELRASMRRMKRLVRAQGPLRLSEIESEGKSASWADPGMGKIERRALHELWMRGELMIRSRHGMQKVFDLPERVLPPETDTSFPSARETAEFHVRRALRALGVARLPELHYLRDAGHAEGVRKALAGLIRSGEAAEVEIEGAKGYALRAQLEQAERPVARGAVRILSPFDNFTIQRKRLKWLFDFDYVVEIYVPAAKRKFGYFTMPLLWGDRLIGRMDAKADRAARRLLIHRLEFEAGFRDFAEVGPALKEALGEFARFQGCEGYTIKRLGPAEAKLKGEI